MSAVLPVPVLLAEDDSGAVLLLRRALRRCSVAVALQVVEDGEQAQAYLEGCGPYADRTRHPLPVLLLLDWKLPRRSGLEVLRWVREQPALDALPVVVLTSSAEGGDLRQAYAARANSYLQKPVSFEQLCARLDLLLTYWLHHNIGRGCPALEP